MAVREVVSVDTSFWVHAGMVRAHHELLTDFEVTITSAVADELGTSEPAPSSVSGQALKVALQHGTVKTLDPHGPLIAEFHDGERAVLTLAMESKEKVMPLIDEVKAYQWAVKKQLPVLSVPLWLATRAARSQEDPMAAIAKIKALVQGRHISMLLAHEALFLLAAQMKRGI